MQTLEARDEFLNGLVSAIGKPETYVALHEPEFTGNELNYVRECIETGWVSSVGKFVDEFELRLAEYTGAKYAIAVVNGTAAQHIAMLLVGVHANDEVLIPSLSFVATANAVKYCGAIPHFVDSSENTLGIDPEALDDYIGSISELSQDGLRNIKTGRKISAIVPMHTFGHPVDMDALVEVAAKYKLSIVEDAAESLGSYYKGRHTGTFGEFGILSFNGNKIITTGGGGAILTNDAEKARRAKHLTTTAKIPHRWEFHHDEVAFNYRLPNLNAALGCAQLERLPDFINSKRSLAAKYAEVFSQAKHFRFVNEPDTAKSNYWLNGIKLNRPDMMLRDELLSAANDLGFQTRPAWKLLHTLPMYQMCPRSNLPVAESLESSLISIPSSPCLIKQR